MSETTVTDPRTDEQMKDAISSILRDVRHERDAWDGALATLRRFLEGELKHAARDLLTAAARRERLELQWKLDELLEATAPPKPKAKAPPVAQEPPPEPEPEPAPPEPQALRPEDLVPIYDDPRGLMIHRHKADGRWFLTQVNPADGQPQTVEVASHHQEQIKSELSGSPYWVEKSWDAGGGDSGSSIIQ